MIQLEVEGFKATQQTLCQHTHVLWDSRTGTQSRRSLSVIQKHPLYDKLKRFEQLGAVQLITNRGKDNGLEHRVQSIQSIGYRALQRVLKVGGGGGANGCLQLFSPSVMIIMRTPLKQRKEKQCLIEHRAQGIIEGVLKVGGGGECKQLFTTIQPLSNDYYEDTS